MLLFAESAPPVRAQAAAPAVPASSPVTSPPLTLDQAISEAFASNPQAAAAEKQLAQAQARVGQAQAQRRFQITFNSAASASNGDVYQPPPSSETFGTLQNSVTVPLPLGRKPGLAVEQARRQYTGAEAQYESARLALAGQVTAAYYDVLRKQALWDIAQETLDQAQRELADARKRNAAGDVAQLDVLQAQVPVASAQAGVAKAQNDLSVARQTLNDLIGRPLDAPVLLAEAKTLPPPLSDTLEQARALAVQRSADVRAADAAVQAAEAALEAARLYREPAYSLQASDTRSGDKTGFSREDTLQASVTLPLSDGGLGAAQVREADAALAQARAQAQVARKTALTGVSAAYLTAQSARAQADATAQARDIAQVTYDKTVRGYENGLFPLINVLNAQNALAQAQAAYVQALYDALTADAALRAAVTGGTNGPSSAVSGAPAGKGTP
jgi:outer membrane protein